MRKEDRNGAWMVGLLGILLLAVALRFSSLGWDSWLALHPDERGILYRAEALAMPSSAASFFQSESPLNPLRSDGDETYYAYGHLHLYIVRGLAGFLGLPVDLAGLSLASRLLSAFLDTLTVLVTASLARRLYNTRAGMLAGIFASLAVALIQNSHFGTVDSGLAFFCLLSLCFLHRAGDGGNPRAFIASGIAMGLGAGFKITALFLTIPILLSWLLWKRRGLSLPSPLAPLGAALAVFFVTSPYALIDAGTFLRALSIQAQMVSGRLDWPFVYQYGDAIPMLTMLKDLTLFSLGLPLAVACLAGLIAAFVRWNRDRQPPAELPIYTFTAVMLLVVGLSEVPFPRYLLPALPPLIIMGAGAVDAVPSRAWSRALAAFLLLTSGLFAAAFMAIYPAPHPWIEASRWIGSAISPGQAIAFERYDEPLPLPLPQSGGGEIITLAEGQVILIDSLAPQVNLSAWAAPLSGAEYFIIASPRVTNAVSGSPARFTGGLAFYRALFAGDLGFSLERSFSRPLHIGPLLLDTSPYAGFLEPSAFWSGPILSLGRADESFSLYDHPVVLVFRNEAHLDEAALLSALEAYRRE